MSLDSTDELDVVDDGVDAADEGCDESDSSELDCAFDADIVSFKYVL
jgi:hypothetical protein